MSANLIIGSSHALNLAQAVGDFSATADEANDNIIKIKSRRGAETHLLHGLPNPKFARVQLHATGQWAVTYDRPMDEVRTFDTPASKVIFMLGGNEPSAYFFQKNPRPFDFFLPEQPGTDVRRQILPLSAVTGIIEDLTRMSRLATEGLLSQLPTAAKFYVPPPPPIPSEAHIRSQREIFDFDTHGVEDKAIRLKLYRVHMRVMMAFCQGHGISFVGPSAAQTDDEGFLREDYWEGCTHAKAAYYAGVVDDLGL